MNAVLADIPTDQLAADAWRAGELSWKLDPHQVDIYDRFHEWNARRQTPEYTQQVLETGATLDSVWVEEIARRFGKTTKWLVMLFELALQRPGAVFTYATALQKDIGDIIVPLSEMLSADAPAECRPKYRGSYMAYSSPVLHFAGTNSVIKLVGVDKNPDGLRGRFSDGIVVSEARDVRKLEALARGVLLPQFQRRPWAFLALESSTPEEPDHDLVRIFRPDAEARDAYVMRTLDDNVVITEAEKAKAIREAGGRGHPVCEREFYCRLIPDPERLIVPEFNAELHVGRDHVPAFALTFVCVDPGVSDKLAILWGYVDFVRQKLVIQRSWAKSNAPTSEVADVIRETEAELWGGAEPLRYWDGKAYANAPYQRWSDVDKRILLDLRLEHGITVHQTAKDDADAQVASMRTKVGQGKVEIWPNSGPLEAQLIAGRRVEGKRPSEWERSDVHGHYDAIACLMYLLRNVSFNKNPFPPQEAELTAEMALDPAMKLKRDAQKQRVARAVLGGGKRRGVWR